MKSTVFKRAFSLFLALVLFLPLMLIAPAKAQDTSKANEGEMVGATFATNVTYTTSLTLDKTPVAFEATVKLPAGYTSRAGVIFGNYSSNGTPGISFEMAEGCKPRIYCTASNITASYIFNTSIPTGEDVHLAVTLTDNKATLYVNGEAKETKTIDTKYYTVLPTAKYMVGGDLRGGNAQYFKGEIKNVAVYSAPLTENEIKESGVNYSSADLLCAYDLTGATVEERIKDLSTNGIDLIYSDPNYDKTELAKALTFTYSDTYKMCKNVSAPPVTIEAEIFLPTGVTDRGGVILGNYSQHRKSVNLEIYTGGNPRLYFEGQNGTLYNFIFDKVDIRGSWVNLAVVLDAPNGLVHCYVNGKLRQTINNGAPIEIDDYEVYSYPLYLGRDTRGGDGLPFRGAIKSLAVYEDIRTADEILADIARVDTTDENILAAYYFTEESGRNDITSNAHHIYYDGEQITPPAGGDDGDDVGGGDVGGGDVGGGDVGGGDEGDTPDITTLNGMTFESGKYAIINGSLQNNAPLTIEATLLIPSTVTDRVGVIVGNYNDNSNYFSIEVIANGVPRFCFPSSSNGVVDIKFEKLHVNTGKVVHLSFTYDPTTGIAACYVNGGEQSQTRTFSKYTYHQDVFSTLLVLGNDLRGGSAQYFKGTLGSLAIYSDVRTETEIKQDYSGIDVNNDNLVIYYDLTDKRFGDEINNLAGSEYDIVYKPKSYADSLTWFDKDEAQDYLYSFAIVGDTQIIAQNHSSDFHKIYDWIIANCSDKKIGYVFGLGDITNGSSSAEWNVASENIFRLNGVVPYSTVRGNHDKLGNYNSIFASNSEYMSQFDGFYAENNATNTYRKITIGNTKFLMITLDYGASDDVLNWAGDIISTNKDHKVIISTHAYLYRDGTTLDQSDVCPPATTGGYNNGDHMWNKLISQHENIFLVLSGHDPSAKVVMSQQTGVHGNLVTQLLVDPQGVDTSVPTGMVTMLYIKADGTMEIETYSTIQEKYYKEDNQFVISETEHNYTTDVSFTYANGYTSKGALVSVCEACQYTHTFETAPLFVFNGYSIQEKASSSICAGYVVEFDLVNKYEAINNTEFSIGMVAAPYANLINTGKPINPDGTAGEITSGKIQSYVLEKEYRYVDLILKSSDWNKFTSYEVILCLFVIEETSVGYICDDTVKETASSVTYSNLLETLK